MEGLARTSYFVLPGVGVPGCLLYCLALEHRGAYCTAWCWSTGVPTVLPGVGVPGCLLLCVLLLCGCNDMVSDEWLVAGG